MSADDLQQLGFWKDFGRGFKKGFTGAANIASKAAKVLVPIG